MEALVKRQTTLSGFIVRMWSNFLKAGQARMTQPEASSRLAKLEDYWTDFQTQHFDILDYPESSKADYVIKDVYTITEDGYFEVRSQLLTLLESFKAANESAKLTPEAAPLPLVKQMQLPKLNLPKFSGDQLT